MAISPAFTASQSGLTPNIVTLEDTSGGSDPTITNRRVYFQTNQGTYLVPTGTSTDYVVWSYADTSAAFNIMGGIDYALSVRVDWLNSSDVVVATLTQLFCFPQWNKNFFYYLIQNQALSPNKYADTNYAANLALYWVNIIGAMQAIEIGADIAASQNCLNIATNMKLNQNYFFI